MIKPISEKQEQRPELDLTGPDGNAFALLGYAQRWGTQLGLDTDAILAEMQSGDYEHLVKTFDRHFGDYVTLYR